MRFLRLVLALAMGILAAGCAGGKTYLAEADAPDSAKAGQTSGMLALTQTFGAALSPIVRNVRAPHGELIYRKGLAEELMADLQPLDIVLIRSRPAMTRLFIPSHFTHAIVWLGTQAEMRQVGALSLAEVQPYRGQLADGRMVLESAKDSVHLSPFNQMIDVDEIVVLRVREGGNAWRRKKYAALFARLGKPFDYNFDVRDETRLTCAELVSEVFPEFKIPIRYARGRYTIVPDDIARLAVEGSRHLSVRRYYYPDGPDSYATGGREAVRAVLSSPAVAAN